MDLKQRILALLDQGENFRHAPEVTLEAIRAEVTAAPTVHEVTLGKAMTAVREVRAILAKGGALQALDYLERFLGDSTRPREAGADTLRALAELSYRANATSRTEIKTQSADGLNGTTVIETGANASGVTEYKPRDWWLTHVSLDRPVTLEDIEAAGLLGEGPLVIPELTIPAEGRGYAQPHRALVPQGSRVFATPVEVAAAVAWRPAVETGFVPLPHCPSPGYCRLGYQCMHVEQCADLGEPVWQYYYRVDACKATAGLSPDCICWHDEGTGPRPEALRADAPDSASYWRVKA